MRYFHQTIAGISLLSSSMAYAVDFYADALYWRASESVDWALTNSNISPTVTPNQVLSYKTIDFNFDPGFRIGVGLPKEDWSIRLFYTRFNTDATASTSGNVISTFMPSKFNTKFYQSAEVDFAIDFNMLDFELTKSIQLNDGLMLSPFVGLRGGYINQDVNTHYRGPINLPPASFNPNNVLEQVSNDFSGIGPLIGVDSQWTFYNKADLKYSLIADLAASYLWGRWDIRDSLYQDNGQIIGGLDVGKRDLGAFTVGARVGFSMAYKQLMLNVGYEVSDWFNQYQVFDNGSGTHTNDLVLQGLTIGLKYTC